LSQSRQLDFCVFSSYNDDDDDENRKWHCCLTWHEDHRLSTLHPSDHHHIHSDLSPWEGVSRHINHIKIVFGEQSIENHKWKRPIATQSLAQVAAKAWLFWLSWTHITLLELD
jgi:hypothetical protein